MTFDQVLVFHKVVETGSFKAAAAEVRKTQPAISFAIKKLEEEMDAPLFDRSGYKPVLTSHGKAFYEKSLQILEGMNQLDALTNSFRNKEEPEVSVSIDGISPLPNLLHVFKNFGARFPNTKLSMSFDILSESERKILQREAQIGVTHFLSEPKAFEAFPITKVSMIPVIHSEIKLTRQSQLKDIHQIVITEKNSPSTTNFGLLDGGKKWRLNDGNFKRDIILAGLGWGHLPEHTIEREIKEGKLRVLKFADIYPRELDIYLIRLKRLPLGLVARALWDELASLSK
jgi:DNA-binding transcriptional LysR family regulator